MTKKDYELIASVLKHNYTVSAVDTEFNILELLISEMAFRLKADNPKFDREKFLELCGIEDA